MAQLQHSSSTPYTPYIFVTHSTSGEMQKTLVNLMRALLDDGRSLASVLLQGVTFALGASCSG